MKPHLRKRVFKYLITIVSAMMVIIMICMLALQLRNVTSRSMEDAEAVFEQVGNILMQNEEDLEEISEDYSKSCLANAETVAYILESKPEILENENIEELFRIAEMVEINEIHIFNKEGVIIFGTQPQYYGYSVNDGEQISFFKPMVTDRTLKLVQGIEKNTAEGKLVQYSAVWSPDEEFILQIGMYPESVLRARAKNELSYIFSLLKTNYGVDFFAIDPESHTILGCTNTSMNNRTLERAGFPSYSDIRLNTGFFAEVDGVPSYVICSEVQNTMIAYVINRSVMFAPVISSCLWFMLGLVAVAAIVLLSVSNYMERAVIHNIVLINESLRKITDGDLTTEVKVNDYQEFEELSSHINEMVHSLTATQKQIEKERDMDLLTGLLNRRGLEHRIDQVLEKGEFVGYCALIMADADGLKKINDTYGHNCGDAYLRRIAETLNSVGVRKSLCSRTGGDEFVLFLYGYENENLLDGVLENLRMRQSGHLSELENGVMVELEFSIGFYKAKDNPNYRQMYREADERMYENKRYRKGSR